MCGECVSGEGWEEWEPCRSDLSLRGREGGRKGEGESDGGSEGGRGGGREEGMNEWRELKKRARGDK